MSAIIAQRLADAARARGDERTRTTAMRAQQCRIAVVREFDLAEPVRRLHEVSFLRRDDRPGQAQSNRAFFGFPAMNLRAVKRPFDCLRDVVPRLLQTLSQRRRPGLCVAQYLAVGPRQPSAGSRAASVDADDVAYGRNFMRRHADESAACSMVSSRYHLREWYAIGLHSR